jgi:hypothetical protein
MMKQIIEALRAHYEWVLIDAPPLLAMADAPVLCPLVDGVVMVIAAESATKPAVIRAIDQVTSVGGKVAGLVLNKVNLERTLLLQPVLRRVLPELLRVRTDPEALDQCAEAGGQHPDTRFGRRGECEGAAACGLSD